MRLMSCNKEARTVPSCLAPPTLGCFLLTTPSDHHQSNGKKTAEGLLSLSLSLPPDTKHMISLMHSRPLLLTPPPHSMCSGARVSPAQHVCVCVCLCMCVCVRGWHITNVSSSFCWQIHTISQPNCQKLNVRIACFLSIISPHSLLCTYTHSYTHTHRHTHTHTCLGSNPIQGNDWKPSLYLLQQIWCLCPTSCRKPKSKLAVWSYLTIRSILIRTIYLPACITRLTNLGPLLSLSRLNCLLSPSNSLDS